MGAYDNPRFINAPNYMAGTQAFLTTFQKGYQQEWQKGQDMITDRKAYEDGVYKAGEQLKEELDAALGNSADSKSKIQSALKQFYDDALSVDMPTKKGLGGLFAKPTEKRLGKLDLIEAQNSFTDAAAGVNTAFNYVYNPEIDINENEDQGHDYYNDKLAIYEAVKAGKHDLKFDYASGKFTSSITVPNPKYDPNKPEGPGNEKTKTYDPATIQAIFTASGKEDRDAIDNSKTEFDTKLLNRTNTGIEEVIVNAERYNLNAKTDFDAIARGELQEMMGTKDMSETAMPDNASMTFMNNMYNNHADNVSSTQQVTLIREQLNKIGVTEEQISDQQILGILNERMLEGEGYYAEKFKGLFTKKLTPEKLNKHLIFGKAKIVEESFMNTLRSSGIINKARRKVAEKTGGDGGTGGTGFTDEDRYFRQIGMETTANINAFLPGGADGGKGLQQIWTNPDFPSPTVGTEADAILRTSLPSTIKIKDGIIENVSEGQVDDETKNALLDYGNSFLNKKFNFRGSNESASGVEISKDGKIRLAFDGKTIMQPILDDAGTKTGERPVTLKDKTLEFDIYDPVTMRSFYNAISPEKGGTGSKAMGGYSAKYDANMVAQYTTSIEGLLRLNEPGMDKWIEFVATGNNGQVKGGMGNIMRFIKRMEDTGNTLSKEMKAFKNDYIEHYYKENKLEPPTTNVNNTFANPVN